MRRMANTTLPTCSQSSTPKSSAARAIISRFAPAAKLLSFHFFLTDDVSRSRIERDGRTRQTAVINPVTSSQAVKFSAAGYRAGFLFVPRGL